MSSGHVLIKCKLPCIINDDHIFLSFGMDLPDQSSCHLYMACQLLQNQASGHIKVKKGLAMCFTLYSQSRYWECMSHLTKSINLVSFGQNPITIQSECMKVFRADVCCSSHNLRYHYHSFLHVIIVRWPIDLHVPPMVALITIVMEHNLITHSQKKQLTSLYIII